MYCSGKAPAIVPGHPLVSDANYNPRGQARRHFASWWNWWTQMKMHENAVHEHNFKSLNSMEKSYRPIQRLCSFAWKCGMTEK
jgi:hypothetical protein